eukprot:jgi/Mesvir1/14099/Mv20234-RA.1
MKIYRSLEYTAMDTEDAVRAAREAPPCTRVGAYLQSFCNDKRACGHESLSKQRAECAKGVSTSLTRGQAVQLASLLQHDIPARSLETATKADLCALISDEMIENVTRVLCMAELARHADSKTRLAIAASDIVNQPFHSVADMSRESLSLLVGSSFTPEQRASAIKLNCAQDIFSTIPWREIGKSAVTDPHPCDATCLVEILHLLVTMLCTRTKEQTILDHLPLVSRVALTPARVWNAVAAMDGTLEASLRGMVGAESTEEAKASSGGDAAIGFYNNKGHAVGQSSVSGTQQGACTAAVVRRHAVRSAYLQQFLKSNRSRVYDEPSSKSKHKVQSACMQVFKKDDPKAYEGAVFPKSHPVGSACILRLHHKGKDTKHATHQAPVSDPAAPPSSDAQIEQMLFTVNPTSRVGNVSAVTLCG